MKKIIGVLIVLWVASFLLTFANDKEIEFNFIMLGIAALLGIAAAGEDNEQI